LICAVLVLILATVLFGVLGVAAGILAVVKYDHSRGGMVVTLSADEAVSGAFNESSPVTGNPIPPRPP